MDRTPHPTFLGARLHGIDLCSFPGLPPACFWKITFHLNGVLDIFTASILGSWSDLPTKKKVDFEQSGFKTGWKQNVCLINSGYDMEYSWTDLFRSKIFPIFRCGLPRLRPFLLRSEHYHRAAKNCWKIGKAGHSVVKPEDISIKSKRDL